MDYFLSHKDKPIDAMYDCCCGGVTPSHISGIPHSKTPYLARNHPCKFCENTKIFAWKTKIALSDFIIKLKSKFPKIRNVTKITIIERDKADIVKKIKIFDNKKSYLISGKDFYSFFKNVKSFIFSIDLENSFLNVIGKGYGHHKGLCQWGAHEMVKQDKSCLEVLNFYYPGAKLKKISN